MRLQIASGTNLVVQVSRLQDGSRKVTHVTEVLGFDSTSGTYQLQDLFVRRYGGVGPDGRIVSELAPTGAAPTFVHQLEEHGEHLPASMLEAIERAAASRGRPYDTHVG
jgi:pilus assembly protein CpaF